MQLKKETETKIKTKQNKTNKQKKGGTLLYWTTIK